MDSSRNRRFIKWQAGRLLFFSPATGEYLRDLDEAEDALQISESARERAEADLRRESVARQRAEAEVAQLRGEM